VQSFLEQILYWLSQYKVNVVLSLFILLLYVVLQRMAIPRLEAMVEQGSLKNKVLKQSVAVFRLLNGVVVLVLILFIWGFDFQWLLAASSGIIALTGVALFANWSILSNITAFFILLSHQSYKRGTFIRILEADNYVEGVISDINLFNTRLISDNREYIIYPNNLLIARPTMINPKIRYSGVGKIQEFNPNFNIHPKAE
jgi:small-conductance mechanosensitive channel